VTRKQIAILMLAVAASASCARTTRYVNGNSDFATVKTVATLPFENLTMDKLAGERLSKIFLIELRALEAFQLVAPGEVTRALRSTGIDPASLATEDVKRIGQTLHAQAIFVGTVVEYDEGRGGGTPMPQVTLQFRLIDTQSATTLWSVSRTSSGATVTARLFGLGGKTASVVAQEMIQEELKRLVH